MRIELSRATAESVELRVGKERAGRVSAARSIPWSAFESAPVSESKAVHEPAPGLEAWH
jgi:hypothetical protein